MKTCILATLCALALLSACSTTDQANASAHLAAFNAEAAKLSKNVAADLASPQGQQLLIDAASAVFVGALQASEGQEGATASTAIGGALTFVHDAAALPSLSGSQLAQGINSTATTGTNTGKQLADTANTIYTTLRGKGVPQKSALAAIANGLQKAQVQQAVPKAVAVN